MATILLTAAGTLLGGPVGGAIGALAGRSIDGAIIGGGRREGPRLRELHVTTSSYGQPIARHHGRMRAGGTIVWATDLVEHASKSGGKKGRPSVASYSYTISFAVALSSRPILGLGRIWADGNLLRGEAGDLKVGGMLRVHTGHGDQAPDPLIAAAQGEGACPAFRDCAYAVFEDLALEEFGNRIPALTFEILADDGGVSLGQLVETLATPVEVAGTLAPLAGFADEGGPLASTIATIDTLFPLVCDAGGARLALAARRATSPLPPLLPPSIQGWDETDDPQNRGAPDEGSRHSRDDALRERPDALRYYDVARDYQAGVQRPAGRAAQGRGATIEFPGALGADDARTLADDAARRSAWRGDALAWRVAELDPALAPGRDVRVPGRAGVWRIEGWEWRSRGIELELVRCQPRALGAPCGDPGAIIPPVDRPFAPTYLLAFEAPPAGTEPAEPTLFAAACGGPGWNGAALYLDRAGELIPIGHSGRASATIGHLAEPLAASFGLLFEPDASLEIDLVAGSAGFAPAPLAGLAMGANRVLVGGEVIQFALAQENAPGRWRLTGLLRGRGGTEPLALAGHEAGTPAVLLDDAIVALDTAQVPSDPATTIAAIGSGDSEPVRATLAYAGLGRRPPCPVHPVAIGNAEGGIELAWTRRARGAWTWTGDVEVPLVEETESYRVGVGPVSAPYREWLSPLPRLALAAAEVSALGAAHPGAEIWVRQVGRYASSAPLLLHRLG